MGFETCGPNEVMVISGFCYDRPRYINGGRIFTWPKIQKVQRLTLSLMTVTVESHEVKTKQGIPIHLIGTAQVKIIPDNIELLEMASELFLNKTEEEISQVALETLQGHQSATIAQMTVEEIYSDRKKFSRAVFECASIDLVNMGLIIASYTVHNMYDDKGYLKAIGQKRAQEAKARAEQGENLITLS